MASTLAHLVYDNKDKPSLTSTSATSATASRSKKMEMAFRVYRDAVVDPALVESPITSASITEPNKNGTTGIDADGIVEKDKSVGVIGGHRTRLRRRVSTLPLPMPIEEQRQDIDPSSNLRLLDVMKQSCTAGVISASTSPVRDDGHARHKSGAGSVTSKLLGLGLKQGRHATRVPLQNISNVVREQKVGEVGKSQFKLDFGRLMASHRINRAVDALAHHHQHVTAHTSRHEDEDSVSAKDSDLETCGTPTVEDVDELLKKDHMYCVEYISEIFNHLRDLEQRRRPASTYMLKQKEVTATMRARLVDWLVEFAQEFKLVPETLYLAINYIDRFMSRKNVPKRRLQLVGVTAMFIAAKYEEIDPCPIEDVVTFCGHGLDADDVLQLEWCMLDVLNFDLNVATTHVFVTRFLQIAYHLFEDHKRLPMLTHVL